VGAINSPAGWDGANLRVIEKDVARGEQVGRGMGPFPPPTPFPPHPPPAKP